VRTDNRLRDSELPHTAPNLLLGGVHVLRPQSGWYMARWRRCCCVMAGRAAIGASLHIQCLRDPRVGRREGYTAKKDKDWTR
jgi:hypothetical protein